MIPRFPSPSVCVIDDEEEDYAPILAALMNLGLGCVHIRGRSGDPLPPKPFSELRLVFTDLHLSNQVGKAAASHTANVVRRVVSCSSGPILMVVWSKYASDPTGNVDLPPEDQPTEADLFKAELLAAEPKFKSRLLFAEMAKPKLPDRPSVDAWIAYLQNEIKEILERVEAFDVLWIWETMVRNAAISVSESITMIPGGIESEEVGDRLKTVLKLLTQRQGGPDCSTATASRHLLSVFSQLGADVLDGASSTADLERHANWLAEAVESSTGNAYNPNRLNAVLLTAAATPMSAMFIPGTVYDVADIAAMEAASGFSFEQLQRDCFMGNSEKDAKFPTFKEQTKPVFLEITPLCDFHQNNRRCATLVAGLACPLNIFKHASSKDACKKTPEIEDRFTEPPVEIGFVFCSRYRLTVPHTNHPNWLSARLRLKDGLVNEIRGWHSSQASRIGYLSF